MSTAFNTLAVTMWSKLNDGHLPSRSMGGELKSTRQDCGNSSSPVESIKRFAFFTFAVKLRRQMSTRPPTCFVFFVALPWSVVRWATANEVIPSLTSSKCSRSPLR